MVENFYLVFIKNIGISLEGKYKYEFYFSDRPEVVWGDYWNVCPASIIPEIKPDINSINRIYECEIDDKLNLAVNNSCFSMQDCIDQIIALGWFDIDSDILYENNVMSFKFGEKLNDVKNKLKRLNIYFDDSQIVYEKQDESEEMIDNLIEKLGGQEDNGGTDDFEW